MTRLTMTCVCCLFSVFAAAQEPSVLRYATEEYVAGVVVKPRQVLGSKLMGVVREAAGDSGVIDKALDELKSGVGIDPREVEELAILLDRNTIYSMSRIPIPKDGRAVVVDDVALMHQMKQIGLAHHNFHDVFNGFTDHDGPDNPDKGNLSWRVHLLPFLGEAALYNQFHKNEPWDSDHNKTLIAKMPQVFKSPGVEDETRTSFHVIVGDNTVFTGQRPTRMRDILDGTSNTIMCVVAAPDKADVWTKPGGLDLKEGPPTKTLGEVGDEFLMLRCDGSVARLSATMDADEFLARVTRNGGEIVPSDSPTRIPQRLPTWLVRTSAPIDQQAVLDSVKPMGDPVEGAADGVTTFTLGEYVIAFPDPKTLVAAPADLMPQLLKSATAGGDAAQWLAKTAAENDASIAIDLDQIPEFRNRFSRNVPMPGLAEGIRSVQATLDVSGGGKHLQSLAATLTNEAQAAQLSALLMGLVQIQKAQILGMSSAPNSPIDAQSAMLLAKLYDNVKVSAEGNVVTYQTQRPENMDEYLTQLGPVLKQVLSAVQTARGAARKAHQRNKLKQIGLAFHNFHDSHRAFPRFNGDANPNNEQARKGLSWRVHLLPFLEHAALYQEFKLNEPWDSEHNRKLVEKMPEVFRTEGVSEGGHTALHVFTGDQGPFGDGNRLTRIRDYTDGTSNTILVVEAGADTAEIWTKPSGLEFKGETPLKLLGNIAETFRVLMCDGAVRDVSSTIDENVLKNLIQHNDGNPVGEF